MKDSIGTCAGTPQFQSHGDAGEEQGVDTEFKCPKCGNPNIKVVTIAPFGSRNEKVYSAMGKAFVLMTGRPYRDLYCNRCDNRFRQLPGQHISVLKPLPKKAPIS